MRKKELMGTFNKFMRAKTSVMVVRLTQTVTRENHNGNTVLNAYDVNY